MCQSMSEDQQSISSPELFMAVLVERLSISEARNYQKSLTPHNKNWDMLEKYMDVKVAKFLAKKNPSYEETQQIKKLIDEYCCINSEKTTAIIVLENKEECYINLVDSKVINNETQQLKFIEPFFDYYSENEYSLIKKNDEYFLKLKTIEPFEQYKRNNMEWIGKSIWDYI